MLKLNLPMLVGIIGGLGGLALSIVVIIAYVVPVSLWMGIGAILFVVIFGWAMSRLLFLPFIRSARLNKIGLPALARVLEIRDTGVSINRNPQVLLTLELRNHLGQVYQAQCRTLVSRLFPGMFSPGMEVFVKVDPGNEQHVMIDREKTLSAMYSKQASVITSS